MNQGEGPPIGVAGRREVRRTSRTEISEGERAKALVVLREKRNDILSKLSTTTFRCFAIHPS